MSNPAQTPDWMPRTAAALAAMKGMEGLLAEVNREVGAFFAAHPEEPRDTASEKLVTHLVFCRLCDSGD
jgi:hypothetical protein